MNETSNPAQTETQVSAPNYYQDPDLAQLLSRLAALLGHSVPAHRYGMMDQTADGVAMADLPRWRRAQELWVASFPSGIHHEKDLKDIERGDFPVIWVADDESQVLLLRGRLSHGPLNAELPDGTSQEVAAEKIAQGRVLMLRVGAEAQSDEELPQTAAEWFAFTVRHYRSPFIDAIFATTLASIIGLVSALYTMQVYDRVVPTKGYDTLIVLTIGVAIAIALELLLKEVRAHIVERACKVIDQELSAIFFAKALNIRMDARPRTVGTFASQIRHFESVRSFMTSSTLFVLADVPFALVFVGVIAMISPMVALVPLVVVPIAILIGLSFRSPIEKYTHLHMEESNRKNGVLIEAIDGIESIKASNGEWKLLDRWRHLVATIAQSEIKMRMLSTLSAGITQSLQQVSYVGMVVVGAYSITQGNLTMGGLIACTIISGRALNPLAQIPGLIVQWKHAQIALKGLDAIMALPSERDPGVRLVVPERCQGHLELEKIIFAYSKDRAALDVPSLQIRPGERVAILGTVGSGKSTLIKIMSGLFKPTQGTVYLDKIDVTQLAPEFVREHVGYLPQDIRLFQGTLRDNLILGLPLPSDSQILKAAAMTGLDQIIQQHPKGLELEITEGGKGLSGGQRQLVGLTRLLLAQPSMMLLDEPTASMDAQTEVRVMTHLFQEVKPDSTLVIVTHKPNFLPLVQRIIVVDRGRIVIDGPRDEVLNRLRQAAAQPQKTVAEPAQNPGTTSQTVTVSS
ncbi:MAG: Toxin translocation ATP-binding protein [Pseudomonadota bacterium]